MHIPPLKPEVLFNLGPLGVTNSMLTSYIVALILCLAAVAVGTNYKRLPAGIQHFFEMVYEMFENLAVDALGKAGRTFVPFVATLFLFIILNNWFGVLPGIGSIGIKEAHSEVHAAASAEGHATEAKPVEGTADHSTEVKPAEGTEAVKTEAKEEAHKIPLFRGGNADLNMTFALALISMAVIHISGIRSAGLGHHLAHFKNPLEIVSELGKILSYSFRLFGNIFAGEVLLAAMGGIIAIVTQNTANPNTLLGIPGGLIAVPFFLFELFVGFIQAFVFAVLTLSFLSLFYKPEGSHAAH